MQELIERLEDQVAAYKEQKIPVSVLFKVATDSFLKSLGIMNTISLSRRNGISFLIFPFDDSFNRHIFASPRQLAG